MDFSEDLFAGIRYPHDAWNRPTPVKKEPEPVKPEQVKVEGVTQCYFCVVRKAFRRGFVGEELPPICDECKEDQAMRKEHGV